MTSGAYSLWFPTLKAKYFPHSSPMFAPARGGSQFWKDLVRVRPLFLENVKFVVGDGSPVRFWLDLWCGDSSLSVSFPTLVSYCPNRALLLSFQLITGTLLFGVPFLLKSSKTGKGSLLSSLCSRR